MGNREKERSYVPTYFGYEVGYLSLTSNISKLNCAYILLRKYAANNCDVFSSILNNINAISSLCNTNGNTNGTNNNSSININSQTN